MPNAGAAAAAIADAGAPSTDATAALLLSLLALLLLLLEAFFSAFSNTAAALAFASAAEMAAAARTAAFAAAASSLDQPSRLLACQLNSSPYSVFHVPVLPGPSRSARQPLSLLREAFLERLLVGLSQFLRVYSGWRRTTPQSLFESDLLRGRSALIYKCLLLRGELLLH